MAVYFYNLKTLRYLELTDGMTIGRSKADVLFKEDVKMSGLHVKIHFEEVDGKWSVFIEDLNSKNKTFIDRVELAPYVKTKLYKHSVVDLGEQSFILTDQNNLSLEEINQIQTKHEDRSMRKIGSEKHPGVSLPDKTKLDYEIRMVELTLDGYEEKTLEMDKEIASIKEELNQQIMELKRTKEKLEEKAKLRVMELLEQKEKLNVEKNKAKDKIRILQEQRK